MRMKKAGFIGFFSVVIMVACVSTAFSIEKEKTLRLSADGLRTLRIDCGAGGLRVVGDSSLRDIEVTARIVAKGISEKRMDDFIADKIRLSLEKRGDAAVLVSEVKSGFRIFHFGRDAYIDLTVRMPEALNLDIDDSSGSVEVESVDGNLRLVDGSGSIDIRAVAGDVEIDDGSGGIDVRDIGGDVSVDDGSGEIEINDVRGNVVVDDGSGSIRIDRVEKDVRIESAGSGGVHIGSVKGRVIR